MKQFHFGVINMLVELLENRFKIFGVRFGLEPLIGLIPGIGDIVSFLLSLYIVWAAKQLHVPQNIISIMIRNVVIDFFIGLIPIVGDVSDFVYRANSKNLKLLKAHAKDIIDGEVNASAPPRLATF